MSLVENKKIYHDYEILETFEAGLVLVGFEVKSLKGKQGSLKGAYVILRPSTRLGASGGETFVVGMHIPPYQPKNTPADYDPYRIRKLLLNKKEISTLIGFEKQKGLTIVPVSVYNKGGKVKIEIAVVRGKKKHDKRETIKRRDVEREIGRRLK